MFFFGVFPESIRGFFRKDLALMNKIVANSNCAHVCGVCVLCFLIVYYIFLEGVEIMVVLMCVVFVFYVFL